MESNETSPSESWGALDRVVGLVARACGVDVRSTVAPPDAEDSPPLEPSARLIGAAERAGLRVARFEATLEDALQAVASGAPWVAPLPGSTAESEEPRWLVLLERRRGKVRRAWITATGPASDAEPAWVSRARLLREVAASKGERISWILADPAAPCADARDESASPVDHAPAADSAGGHGGGGAHHDAGGGHGASLPPTRRLLRLLRPDRGDIWTVVIFSVTIGILSLAVPIAVQAVVNYVALGGAIPPLIVVVALLFLGLALAGLLTAVQTWVVEVLQRRIFVRMVADLAWRLPRVALSTYDRHYGPELVNRFFDVITIQKVSSLLLLDGLGVILSVFVGLVVLAFYHPILLAFDVVLLAVIAVVVFVPARRGIATALEESKAKYSVAGWLEEIARSPLAFKSFGASEWVLARSDALARSYLDRRSAHYRVVFGQIVGALGLQVFASTTLLATGGFLVMQGSLTLGQLVAAELIVTTIVASAAKMGKHLESLYDLLAAVDKLGHLIDLPIETSRVSEPRMATEPAGAALSLRSLTWSRSSGGALFSPITIDVASGERLGIAGPSGSGKSTLVEIIWGLRNPSSGRVLLDGRDVRETGLDALRRDVAVAGPIEIVEASVRENVRLGRKFISDEEVLRALDALGLADELYELPRGLDTPLLPSGAPLSEGQIRRLLLARAMVARPRLLIVEDLLDPMSSKTREIATAAILGNGAPWTVIVVSNDADVLARMDRVLHLPEGKVTSGSSQDAARTEPGS